MNNARVPLTLLSHNVGVDIDTRPRLTVATELYGTCECAIMLE